MNSNSLFHFFSFSLFRNKNRSSRNVLFNSFHNRLFPAKRNFDRLIFRHNLQRFFRFCFVFDNLIFFLRKRRRLYNFKTDKLLVFFVIFNFFFRKLVINLFFLLNNNLIIFYICKIKVDKLRFFLCTPCNFFIEKRNQPFNLRSLARFRLKLKIFFVILFCVLQMILLQLRIRPIQICRSKIFIFANRNRITSVRPCIVCQRVCRISGIIGKNFMIGIFLCQTTGAACKRTCKISGLIIRNSQMNPHVRVYIFKLNTFFKIRNRFRRLVQSKKFFAGFIVLVKNRDNFFFFDSFLRVFGRRIFFCGKIFLRLGKNKKRTKTNQNQTKNFFHNQNIGLNFP